MSKYWRSFLQYCCNWYQGIWSKYLWYFNLSSCLSTHDVFLRRFHNKEIPQHYFKATLPSPAHMWPLSMDYSVSHELSEHLDQSVTLLLGLFDFNQCWICFCFSCLVFDFGLCQCCASVWGTKTTINTALSCLAISLKISIPLWQQSVTWLPWLLTYHWYEMYDAFFILLRLTELYIKRVFRGLMRWKYPKVHIKQAKTENDTHNLCKRKFDVVYMSPGWDLKNLSHTYYGLHIHAQMIYFRFWIMSSVAWGLILNLSQYKASLWSEATYSCLVIYHCCDGHAMFLLMIIFLLF